MVVFKKFSTSYTCLSLLTGDHYNTRVLMNVDSQLQHKFTIQQEIIQ